jgi:monoamine oxidase
LDTAYVEKIYDQIDGLIDDLEADIDKLKTDWSLLALIEAKYAEYIKKLAARNNLSAYQIETIRTIYEARLKEEKFDTACDPLDFLSAIGWNEFVDSSGDDMINIKGGYASFVNYFVSRISASRIRLNEVVRNIDYSMTSTQKVRVTTQNRITGVMSVFDADQVLVTIPLGYLKSYHRSMFKPTLPAVKVNAIDKLGFGTVNKMFLVFSQNFAKNFQGAQVLWRRDLGSKKLSSMVKWGIDVIFSILFFFI